MKRSEIRTFIKTGVDNLSPPPSFGSGLYTYFNSHRGWSYDNGHVFHESIGSAGDVGVDFSVNQVPNDGYNVKLWIAFLTTLDAVPEDYEPLIDMADEIAQKLTYQYNQIVSGYKLVTLTGMNRTPFVKKNADILAGVTLTFSINSPDKTTVC